MTPQEVKTAAGSLRAVGGVYEYVAACVEYDNRGTLAVEKGTNG